MARDYANVFTAIWREADFRALHASEQRTYFLLVTQPDISAAGTLALTTKRWAGLAADTDRSSIERDLKGLEAAAFVFVDHDTEELLVRTFVKHDKGYGNPKRRPVILAAARALESPRLRAVLWGEMDKLGLTDMLPPLGITPGDSLSDSPSDALSDSHADTHPDRPSGTQRDSSSASERVVVTEVGTTPQASNRKSGNRETANHSAPPSAASAKPPTAQTVTQRANALTKPYYDAVGTMCNFPAVAKIVAKAINSGRYSDDQIRDALERMATDGRSVTVDSLRTELDGIPLPRASSRHQPYRNPADVSAYDKDLIT